VIHKIALISSSYVAWGLGEIFFVCFKCFTYLVSIYRCVVSSLNQIAQI